MDFGIIFGEKIKTKILRNLFQGIQMNGYLRPELSMEFTTDFIATIFPYNPNKILPDILLAKVPLKTCLFSRTNEFTYCEA